MGRSNRRRVVIDLDKILSRFSPSVGVEVCLKHKDIVFELKFDEINNQCIVTREEVGLKKYISPNLASNILNMSRPTIIKLINSGEIPACKVGSHYRLDVSDVMEYKKRMSMKI